MNRRGVAPETVEVVIGTGGLREDVDNKIAVIKKNPLRRVVAFGTEGQLTNRLQLLRNLVCYRMGLTRIRDGTDDEVIGEGSDFAEVKNLQIKGFFGFSCPGRGEPVR